MHEELKELFLKNGPFRGCECLDPLGRGCGGSRLKILPCWELPERRLSVESQTGSSISEVAAGEMRQGEHGRGQGSE